MNERRIELELRHTTFCVKNRDRGLTLCKEFLIEDLTVPENIKFVDLVYTKKPIKGASFTLDFKFIKEYYMYLFTNFEFLNNEAYLDGYRYCHIEY